MTRTEALDYRKKVVNGETYETLHPYIEKAAGGTIVLQYMPNELVGNYFTAVNM